MPVIRYYTSYIVLPSYKYNTMIHTYGDPMLHLLHRSYLNLDLEHMLYNHRIRNHFYQYSNRNMNI